MKAAEPGALSRELQRKAFHMLSLVYLAAYQLLGHPRVLPWLAAWSAAVLVLETSRLALPRLNAALTGFFGGIARAEEMGKPSGILHTTLGALAVIAAFGDRPRVVSAAIVCVALGDAAAALVGKTYGRRPLPWGAKSLEGSLACAATCAAVCLAHGFPVPASLAAALAGALLECAPTTRVYNDNLWMPVGVAAALASLS